jgi:hypothetical protein
MAGHIVIADDFNTGKPKIIGEDKPPEVPQTMADEIERIAQRVRDDQEEQAPPETGGG